MFNSTKRFGPIPTCHRNWHAALNENRNSQKCAWIHGYSRHVQITFSGGLDACQWVYDFGDCKFIKEFLDDLWDHKVLISSNDPELQHLQTMQDLDLLRLTIIDAENGLNWGPGMEGSCKFLFDNLQPTITKKTEGRVRITRVEVWEHENNSAIFIPNESDFELI